VSGAPEDAGPEKKPTRALGDAQASLPVEQPIPKKRSKLQKDFPIRSVLSHKPNPNSPVEWTQKQAYSPRTELPQSPLLNTDCLKPYAERHPKKPPKSLEHMSEHEERLLYNPFGQPCHFFKI
jgi:hypothetical protein